MTLKQHQPYQSPKYLTAETRLIIDSITNANNCMYRVERPNGRQSSFVFHSKYRAAEHVMKAAKVADWRVLARRGIRIVPDYDALDAFQMM